MLVWEFDLKEEIPYVLWQMFLGEALWPSVQVGFQEFNEMLNLNSEVFR